MNRKVAGTLAAAVTMGRWRQTLAALSLFCASSGSWFDAGPLAAQVAPAPPAKKSLLEEEEEPLNAKPKPGPAAKPAKPASKLPLAGNDEEPPVAVRPAIGVGGGNLDDLLNPAGRDGDEEEVKGEPVFDYVICSVAGGGEAKHWPVKLFASPVTVDTKSQDSYVFDVVNAEGKPQLKIRPQGNQIIRIEYYEERMLRRAATEFGVTPDELSAPQKVFDLSQGRRAATASRAVALLQTALAEHDSAVQRYLRLGDGWNVYRQALSDALINLHLSQSYMLFRAGQVQPSLAASDRLLNLFAKNPTVTKAILRQLEIILIGRAEKAFASQDYEQARELLAEFRQRFPRDPSERADRLRKQMIDAARRIALQARAENNVALLDQAATVWPTLTELEAVRMEIVASYPILNCAYASLPKHFSPLTARTPVERHAVALQFESLVRWVQDPRRGAHYETQLAAERPISLAKGRQFQLPHCVWSDSEDLAPHFCTAKDVVATVALLKKTRPHDFPTAWQQLVSAVDTTQTLDDPFRFDIRLAWDHWQPLSLMDFKVLPQSRFAQGGTDQELKAFEEQPVGTGPFRLASRDPDQVRFTANPNYRKPGAPLIREIRLNQLDGVESTRRFLNGEVHLVYDVQPKHADELSRQGKKIEKLDARSVYFLAPNYSQPAMRNREFRLAIAHVIDRQKILNANFRRERGEQDHAALSGPLLKETWAYNTKVPAFAPTQAAAFAKQAQEKLGNPLPKLQLAYPDRDPTVGAACADIKRDLETLGVVVELKALDPKIFVDTILTANTFDLVYWRHDFDDETYWLWPLFDPADRRPGGANFMNFGPDTAETDFKMLDGLFHEMRIHKQFLQMQTVAHKVHDQLARNAIVIPLWQLNTYVALHPALVIPPHQLDSIQLFGSVETWSLKPHVK